MKQPYVGRGLMIAVCLSVIPLSAAAVTASPAVSQSQHITNLKTKGAAEIDRRLTNLAAATTRLGAAKKLTAADKDALTKQIQDESTGLTALKTKLAAETTLVGARADVASIVTDYRVYVLMLPKAQLVAAADRVAASVANLQDLSGKLFTALAQAQTAGKDVADLQAKFTDMKAKTADAATQIDGLVAKLLAVQPGDYNTNHATLTTYRQSVVAALKDVQTARDDAQAIVDGLKALK